MGSIKLLAFAEILRSEALKAFLLAAALILWLFAYFAEVEVLRLSFALPFGLFEVSLLELWLVPASKLSLWLLPASIIELWLLDPLLLLEASTVNLWLANLLLSNAFAFIHWLVAGDTDLLLDALLLSWAVVLEVKASVLASPDRSRVVRTSGRSVSGISASGTVSSSGFPSMVLNTSVFEAVTIANSSERWSAVRFPGWSLALALRLINLEAGQGKVVLPALLWLFEAQKWLFVLELWFAAAIEVM